jgi:RimJ/RimL family protein N-acetyltransferase
LNTEYQGKGFAIEAFTKVFEYLFTETETHRIIGLLDTENIGSRKLMENLNFRREAEFKKSYWDKKMNEWRDEYLYALLKDDFHHRDTENTEKERQK